MAYSPSPNLPSCPNCKEKQIYILESRKSKDGTRRRRICKACNYRDTTYEVSSTFYQEAKDNALLLSKFRSLLSLTTTEVSLQENKCLSCKYNHKDIKCSFDLPEFNTEESFDCTHYLNV